MGDFRGIILVEVPWKAITILLNLRLMVAISFHDILHRFRAGRRKWTANFEDKLLKQLTSMKYALLFEVFLNLQKTYYALDQERALDILTAHGVGPRPVRLLTVYWDPLTMVAKACRYFGSPFKGYKWFMYRDSLSPTIFNIVIDAAICHWVTVVTPTEAVTVGLGLTIIDLAA